MEAACRATRPAGDTERQHTRETRRQWTRIPNTTAGGTDDHLSNPRLRKVVIVLLDPVTGQVQRVIPLQYNPETLTALYKPRA